MDMTRRLM